MRVLPVIIFIVSLFLFQYTSAQITVSGANSSSNGTYATLQAAFIGINSFNQAGNTITVTVTANTTETGSAVLNQNTGTWTSLTISPSGTRTISGNISGVLVDLDGADYVTIDGLNSGGNSLTLENSNTATGAATIRFVNDAKNNAVTRCYLKGSGTGLNGTSGHGAVVWFFNSAVSTGNDDNTISYCDIGPSGSNLPFIGIRSYTNVSSRSNDNITITENNVHDFFSATSPTGTSGINVFNYNSNWTITNNRIYQTATRTYTAATYEYRGIYISTTISTSSGNFTVTGNVIGYSSSSGTGTTTITGSSNIFNGITLNANSSSPSSTISNNTIAGIDQTTSRAPTASSGSGVQAFIGIGVFLGAATVSNNIIGSTSSTGSIIIRTTQVSNSTVNCISLILNQGSSSNTISGNQLGGISIVYSSGGSQTMSFVGIRNESTGTTTISSNIIGNSASGNITTNQGNAGLTAIDLAHASGSSAVTSNTIQNLNHSGTLGATTIVGIYSQLNGGAASFSISQNLVYNLACTNTTTSSVYGILLSGSSSGSAVQNRIYGLSVGSTSPTGTITGLRTLGTSTLSNNMITIGSSVANNPIIYGIDVAGGAPTMYYNSVVITGAATGTASNAYCLNVSSTSANYNIQNNIFYNTRSSSNNASNRAIHFSGSALLANVITGNYNNLCIGSPNTVLGSVGATTYANLGAWQGGSGKDANSISTSVTFTSIASDLHVTDCALAGKGTTISGTTSDYDGSTRNTIPWIGADEPFITWNGGTGNWNVAGNWTPNIIPASYHDVIISSGSVSLNADAFCHSITIGTGVTVSANIYKLSIGGSLCTNSFFVNNGTFNANTGTVEFLGANSVLSGYIGGTAATTFNNVTLNTGITFPASPFQSTVNSSLQLNSGSYVNSNSPIYGSSSTLTYNTNGSYNVSLEWTSTFDGVAGSGRPHNVTIVNSTVNIPTSNRAMAGALTINLLGTLVLNATSGDLYIRGNWSDQGTFTPNNRAVFFTGLTDQTITRVGGGTESFPYFIVNKPNSGTYVKPDNTAGNLTDVSITGQAGDVLQLLNNGSLDLNGRTVTIDGNSSGSSTGNIYVNGTRTITNNQGINNGKFEIRTTIVANQNQPTWYTKSVANNSGTGSLIFDQNVLVTIADGRMDWGFSAGTNITTIQGVLQINLGGSVYPNSCYYSASPASTLRFANTVDYQVNSTDKTWASGLIYSGAAGIPYNVEVNNTGTDLTINDTRALRNNLSIMDGTFTLNAGPFNIGGNWNRSGATSGFTPNTNRVVFDGNADQTITSTANSNTETFYQLEISNNDATPQVSHGGSTDITVTNQLVLTTGILSTGTNEVYVTNSASTAVTGHQTNPSLAGYVSSTRVNGNLRRNLAVSTNYDFPVGTSTNYQLATLYFSGIASISDVLAYFTTGTSGTFTGCTINGTAITGMLDGGYWTLTPTGNTTGVVYDLTLYETGYTNSISSTSILGLIKRSNSVNPWSGTDYGSDGIHSNSTQAVYSGPVAKAVRTNVPTFSDYAIGYSNDIVLPVELTEFDVIASGDDALLSWITSAELNSDYFAIERSSDGVEFSQIGVVDAAGNSFSPVSYIFVDKGLAELNAEKIYYRLRMTDLDQSFEYSPVRWITLDDELNGTIQIFPNPFIDEVNLLLNSSEEGNGMMQLIDVSGKIIAKKYFTLSFGMNVLAWDDLPALSNGVYFLRVASGRMILTEKLIKN